MNKDKDHPDMTQIELLQTVLQELSSIKKSLPNGELKLVMKSVDEMKEDLADIKEVLMDPEDGVIVKVNKNTEFRKTREGKLPYCDSQFREIAEIKKWKEGVTKALWIIFAAILGIVLKLLFFGSTGIVL